MGCPFRPDGHQEDAPADQEIVVSNTGSKKELSPSLDAFAVASAPEAEAYTNAAPATPAKSTEQIAAEIVRIASQRGQLCSSKINRVFKLVFGSSPWDIATIAKTCLKPLSPADTDEGKEQRRNFSFILAAMEACKDTLDPRLKEYFFNHIVNFTRIMSIFSQADETDEELAKKALFTVRDVFGDRAELMASIKKIVHGMRPELNGIFLTSLPDGDKKPHSNDRDSSGTADASLTNPGFEPHKPNSIQGENSSPQPTKPAPEQIPVESLVSKILEKENSLTDNPLLKVNQRKWKFGDYTGFFNLFVQRQLQLGDLGCIKDKLLTSAIDNVDMFYFTNLIPTEQARSLNLVLVQDSQKGPKLIAELLFLLKDNLSILKIFKEMRIMDVIEILDSMRPTVLIPLFNKWLSMDRFEKKDANDLIEEIFRRASSYPLLYSLFERCAEQEMKMMDKFTLRVTDKVLNEHAAKEAIEGLPCLKKT